MTMPDLDPAFSSLELRAQALQSDRQLDRISLRDYMVEVEIGAFQVERNMTQRVGFNIVVELTPAPKDVGDDVDLILSYDTLIEAVHVELAAERLNLLETLSERVADRILREDRAVRVFVRIEKFDRVPGALGVEIVRTVDDFAQGEQEESPTVQPLIAYCEISDLRSLGGQAWLDRLEAEPHPVVLCIAPRSADESSAPHERAPLDEFQQRIELLSFEQEAWEIARTDERFTVRASRTELDWAMKQGLMSVWAPSKMVFDAVESPKGTGLELAVWLGEQLNAAQIVVAGMGVFESFVPEDKPQFDYINLANVS